MQVGAKPEPLIPWIPHFPWKSPRGYQCCIQTPAVELPPAQEPTKHVISHSPIVFLLLFWEVANLGNA